MRLLGGVRNWIPLSLDVTGAAFRRAWQQLDSAPGVVVERNRGTQVTNFGRLQPGDLVFFDAATDNGTAIDHVGMYLGLDTLVQHRLVSSRKSIDGPTMGDYRGWTQRLTAEMTVEGDCRTCRCSLDILAAAWSARFARHRDVGCGW